MKIHTDVLTSRDLYTTLAETTTGVYLDRCDERGSRSRKRAFDVALESDGTPDKAGTSRRRRRNFGTAGHYGEQAGFAASYDDWGWWLAALFDIDPNMTATYYASRDDFHAKTNGKYLTTVDAR